MNNTDYSQSYYQVCDWCGLPFTDEEWDNRHTPHEPGCPNGGDHDEEDFDMEEFADLESVLSTLVDCDCDLNYHVNCCPVCNALEESEDTCTNK